MPPEVRETWRSRFSGSADRRGIPLGTIVVSVGTVILLLDLNAALILGLWVLRTILVYVVIAFFITLLLTPATRFLRRRGLSHGGATLLVFLLGVLVLGGLVYLFAEPLVTAAINFGHQVPTLVSQTKKGRGPIGRLVYRLHLQKYLSEDSTKLTSQITKVLKPATALSVGAAAASTVVAIVTIAILTFFTMLEAPRMWRGFLGLFQPSTA
jgi:predicted PurR-regulated permease PerM